MNNYPDGYMPDDQIVYEYAYEQAIQELGANTNPSILSQRAEEIIQEAEERANLDYDAWVESEIL